MSGMLTTTTQPAPNATPEEKLASQRRVIDALAQENHDLRFKLNEALAQQDRLRDELVDAEAWAESLRARDRERWRDGASMLSEAIEPLVRLTDEPCPPGMQFRHAGEVNAKVQRLIGRLDELRAYYLNHA